MLTGWEFWKDGNFTMIFKCMALVCSLCLYLYLWKLHMHQLSTKVIIITDEAIFFHTCNQTVGKSNLYSIHKKTFTSGRRIKVNLVNSQGHAGL